MRSLPALLLLPLLAACQASDPAVSQTPCDAAPWRNAEAAATAGVLPAAPQPMVNLGRRGVRIAGAPMNRAVLVSEVAGARLPDGTGEVSVTLQACGYQEVALASTIQFLDAGGRVIESQAGGALRLPPGSAGLGLRFRSASRPAGFFVELAEAR